jgi:hypothetical protein
VPERKPYVTCRIKLLKVFWSRSFFTIPPYCHSEQSEESWLVRIFPAPLKISPDGRNDNGAGGGSFYSEIFVSTISTKPLRITHLGVFVPALVTTGGLTFVPGNKPDSFNP